MAQADWHLDRKVTIGIIMALLVNAGSSVWWASRLDYTVQTHENRIIMHDKEIHDMKERSGVLYERLARIEANLAYQTDTLKEIKEVLKNQ